MQIDYAGHSTLAPFYHVHFYLQDRSDRALSNLTHSPVVTAKRLRSIAVSSDDGLIRAYQLNYGASPVTSRSVLNDVRIFGNDASVDGNGAITGTGSILAADLGYDEPDEDGLFQKPFIKASQVPAYRTHRLVQLDANGDGAQDFVRIAAQSPNAILINLFKAVPEVGFEHSGTWTLTVPSGAVSIDLSSEITPIHAGDVNGDGKDDLVIAPTLLGDHYCILADANGDLNRIHHIQRPLANTSPPTPWNTYLTDVNGDGLQDLVYMFYRQDTVEYSSNCTDFIDPSFSCSSINVAATQTCLSNGDGTFSDPIPWEATNWNTSEKMSNQRTLRRFADYNGDGKADLLLVRPLVADPLTVFDPVALKTAQIAIGNGNGTFQRPQPLTFSKATPDTYLGLGFNLADFNGDGLMDPYSIISRDPLSMNIEISDGDGTFTNHIVNLNFNIGTAALRVGDMNGDGKSDLVGIQTDSSRAFVRVMFSNGDSTFLPPVDWYDESGGYDKFNPTMGDYDGDGRTDLVFHREDPEDTDYGWHIRVTQSVTAVEGRLRRIENTLGGITEFEYGPVGAYGTARLPYGLSVVTKNRTIEPILNQDKVGETLYAYRGGLHDVRDREFRGFKEVITTAPNGCQSQTIYHQDDFRKGRAKELNTFGPGDVYGGAPGEAHGQVISTWQNYYLDTNNQCAYVHQRHRNPHLR
ncbi:MAG: VCBS repeat-containing protein [Desulfobacterales bacterium]|nr:VCBS repeat-containing protein [Desulfobacterales bacterium]